MQTLSLQTFGPGFRTRSQAMAVRKSFDSAESVTFDATGVEIMTHSFTDELFGRLYEEIGKDGFADHVFLKNFDDEQQVILRRVIQSHME